MATYTIGFFFLKIEFYCINYNKQQMAAVRNISDLSAVTKQVSNLVTSSNVSGLLAAYGLKATRVTWEDTGRSKNSVLGPNISDMTLKVKNDNLLMPVIRTPNFADVTQDVPIDNFQVNYKGAKMSLKALLVNLGLYDDRDTEILTSSQCCILPVIPGEKTQFAVQLFNYQSSREPAVLVILVSKLGTSIQVVNSKDTNLLFDNDGTAHWFSVERLEDVRKQQGATKTRVDSFEEMTEDEQADNTLMMIQVPLKQKLAPSRSMAFGAPELSFGASANCAAFSVNDSYPTDRLECAEMPYLPSGMDMGQIGIGDNVGPYTGTNNTTLVRDKAFPIRCTYQYYRVTDVDYIDETMIKDIKKQLDQSLKDATHSGSLVLNKTGGRVTEAIPELITPAVFTPDLPPGVPTFPTPDHLHNPQFPFRNPHTANVKCPCCNTKLNISVSLIDQGAPSPPVMPNNPPFPFRQATVPDPAVVSFGAHVDIPFRPQFPFNNPSRACVKCPFCNIRLSFGVSLTDPDVTPRPVFTTPFASRQALNFTLPANHTFNPDPAVVSFGGPAYGAPMDTDN